MNNKALLVVSFGTSLPGTRERTITALEYALSSAFPDRTFYRAWTSGMIRKKVQKEEGLKIDSVTGALERMIADGVKDLLVQPTHLLDGEENRIMTDAIRSASGSFDCVRIGAPLLFSEEDIDRLADIMVREYPLDADQLFAWMGHGSSEMKVNVYDRLNEVLAQKGADNVAVGTVEFEPGFDPIQKKILERKPRRVCLAPLMVVAGDHAVNDMAGDEEDSWKSLISAQGCEPLCILRGLGEYEAVRAIYIEHAKNAGEL
jgi:sirohydrochlorin cobaltochelatase